MWCLHCRLSELYCTSAGEGQRLHKRSCNSETDFQGACCFKERHRGFFQALVGCDISVDLIFNETLVNFCPGFFFLIYSCWLNINRSLIKCFVHCSEESQHYFIVLYSGSNTKTKSHAVLNSALFHPFFVFYSLSGISEIFWKWNPNNVTFILNASWTQYLCGLNV